MAAITHPMNLANLRWAAYLVALLVVGPIAAGIIGMTGAPDGAPAPTMLHNASPAMGIVTTLIALALACAMGVATCRLAGPRPGFFAAGVTLLWVAGSTSTVDDVIRRVQGTGGLTTLAIEGAILGALGVGIAWTIIRFSDKRHREIADPPLSLQGAIGVAAALVVAALAAWIIAREGLKGQTIAAGCAAGLFGATVSRVAANQAPTLVCFAAMGLLALISPVLGAIIHAQDIVQASYANQLFALTRLAPMDWIAGAFFGIPLGLSWADSMVEKRVKA